VTTTTMPPASYTLYGAPGSGAAAVEMALVLAGTTFRKVEAASWEAGAGRDELARVSPLLQVPTLVLPDGSVMTESAAILIHLGLAHPDSGLLPADTSKRAQTFRGLVYIAANCYAAIGVIDYPERWCKPADDDTGKRIIAGTKARLHELWERFADQFQDAPWLGGPQLGALDVLAATVSKWSGSRAHLEKQRPEFFRLLQRIDAHPQVAPVFARHWP
jgi:GST-like protein